MLTITGWAGHVFRFTFLMILVVAASAGMRSVSADEPEISVEALKALHDLGASRWGQGSVDELGHIVQTRIDQPNGERIAKLVRQFPKLELVYISSIDDLSPDDLRHLENLPHLDSLWLGGFLDDAWGVAIARLNSRRTLRDLHFTVISGMTDRGVTALAQLTGLESLNLGVGFDKPSAAADKIGADILSQFPHLKSLTLHNAGVSSLTMRALGCLRELRSLHIYGVTRTANDYHHLRNLTRLEEIQLWTHFSDEAAFHLASLKSLKSIFGLSGLTDKGMKHLAGLTNLNQLWIYSDELTDQSLASLSSLAKLEDVVLTSPKITGSGFQHLGDLDGLRRLILRHTNFQPENLRYLTALTALEEIDLGWTPMGDEANWQSLTVLRALPNLKEVQVEGLDRRLDLFETLLPGVQNTYIE